MLLLKEGCCGAEVASLKERLNALNYDCGAGDVFDRRTTWAVCWFRHQNGLCSGDQADEAFWQKLYAPDARLGVITAFQYYSMKDELWAEYPYDAANTPEVERMHNSACGPTSMAMAVSTALHRAVLPPVLADWSNANGFRDPNGIHGTDDSFFPACAENYGLTAELVKIEDERSFARAAAELDRGNSIISNVVPGSPYTSVGHYNLISAVANGKVHICDPVPKNMNLPDYTVQEWLDGMWCRHFIIIAKK